MPIFYYYKPHGKSSGRFTRHVHLSLTSLNKTMLKRKNAPKVFYNKNKTLKKLLEYKNVQFELKVKKKKKEEGKAAL